MRYDIVWNHFLRGLALLDSRGPTALEPGYGLILSSQNERAFLFWYIRNLRRPKSAVVHSLPAHVSYLPTLAKISALRNVVQGDLDTRVWSPALSA